MFGSFLIHYTNVGLKWSINPTTDISSLFWASNLIFKLIAVVLSKRFSITLLWGFSSILVLLPSILTVCSGSLPSDCF